MFAEAPLDCCRKYIGAYFFLLLHKQTCHLSMVCSIFREDPCSKWYEIHMNQRSYGWKKE